MGINNVFENILRQILLDYVKEYNYKPDNIQYRIVEDMIHEYTLLKPDLASKEPEKVATLNIYNGVTVPPSNLHGRFVVLINKPFLLKYIEQDNMTWVGTIVHETTHVKDFIEYADLIGAKDFEDIVDLGKHPLFQLWTESNARAKGYFFVRKYSFKNMYDTQQVPDILNIELPKQIELLRNNLKATMDGFMQAYYLSHFIGRLYTLQRIFPQIFSNKMIQNIFEKDIWLYEWYIFFSKHQDLKSAYSDFEEFRSILLHQTIPCI